LFRLPATILIKKQIEKVVKAALTAGFESIDSLLVTVRDQMDNSKAAESQSRTDVLKDVGLALHPFFLLI